MGLAQKNAGNRVLIIGAEDNTRGFDFSDYREIIAGAVISSADVEVDPATGLANSSATIINDQTLWTAQTANATSNEFVLSGITPITIMGTFGGATVTLEVSTNAGTTWLSHTAYTAGVVSALNFPSAMLGRLVLTGATGTTSITAVVELGHIALFNWTPTTAGQYNVKCLATLDSGAVLVMKATFLVTD